MSTKREEQNLFQCTVCMAELNLYSKTLPCLHSLCRSCSDKYFGEETDEKGHCPECLEPVSLDLLCLSPIIAKFLRRQQLESSPTWRCDLCFEDEIDVEARYWCQDCKKLHCPNCSRIHKKFHRKHNIRDILAMERVEAIEMMTTDMCFWHMKTKDLFCNECNESFCDTCNPDHLNDSSGCSSLPLLVKEEAQKQKSQSATMIEEMDNLELSLKKLNENMENYTAELNSDCDSKCKELWENFEEMMQNAKMKTNKLCEEMRRLTTEKVDRWRHLLEENERILKQLEIWRINLNHLLKESPQDVDAVHGLRSLVSKLSFCLDNLVKPEEKCELEVAVPDWWIKAMEELKINQIGTVSLTGEKLPLENLEGVPVVEDLIEPLGVKKLELEKQWKLNRSNLDIQSIYVNKEDGVIFLCDVNECSIIGFTKDGDFFCECLLFDGTNRFRPQDICPISSDVFVCCCFEKLILLQKRKVRPFLKIKEFIDTEVDFRSLCLGRESVIACDFKGNIYSLRNECKKIDMIRGYWGSNLRLYPRIHSNHSNGNFWAMTGSYEISCFSPYCEKIKSMKINQSITSSCGNELGMFFCNKSGIYLSLSEDKFHKFEKNSLSGPLMYALNNEIFVVCFIDGNYLINIFKIIH